MELDELSQYYADQLSQSYAKLSDEALREALSLGREGYSTDQIWSILEAEARRRGLAVVTAATAPALTVPDPSTMDRHPEFVALWSAGQLSVMVNRSAALSLMMSPLVPTGFRVAHLFWAWIWMLTIPAGLGLMFFYRWWVGLGVLMLLTPAMFAATKKSAQQFVIDAALADPAFFALALSSGWMLVHRLDRVGAPLF